VGAIGRLIASVFHVRFDLSTEKPFVKEPHGSDAIDSMVPREYDFFPLGISFLFNRKPKALGNFRKLGRLRLTVKPIIPDHW
jgi:hypothetical protein